MGVSKWHRVEVLVPQLPAFHENPPPAPLLGRIFVTISFFLYSFLAPSLFAFFLSVLQQTRSLVWLQLSTPGSLFILPTGKSLCPCAHMACWKGQNMVIIMGSSAGRSSSKYVNEGNVESAIHQGWTGRLTKRAAGGVSKFFQSAKITIWRDCGASQYQTEPRATG